MALAFVERGRLVVFFSSVFDAAVFLVRVAVLAVLFGFADLLVVLVFRVGLFLAAVFCVSSVFFTVDRLRVVFFSATPASVDGPSAFVDFAAFARVV